MNVVNYLMSHCKELFSREIHDMLICTKKTGYWFGVFFLSLSLEI